MWDNDIADSESLVINWVGLHMEPSANEGLRLNWLPASFVNKTCTYVNIIAVVDLNFNLVKLKPNK